MLLLLDNYDSFTYNVYQLLSELGAEVEVIRNDQITPEEVLSRGYEAIVLSPGPGVPKDAGITEDLIRTVQGKVPVLGICLGHQAIGEVFGAKIVRAGEIIHGKVSKLQHDGQGVYQGLPQELPVGRYHSLIIERESLPDCLEVTAELADGTIMGIRHKEYAIQGMQFHPESILTPGGRQLMQNFLNSIH
jgi:anthranilate synthase/aminodeoxychorismate synthase-like glutamine amidotransferase